MNGGYVNHSCSGPPGVNHDGEVRNNQNIRPTTPRNTPSLSRAATMQPQMPQRKTPEMCSCQEKINFGGKIREKMAFVPPPP